MTAQLDRLEAEFATIKKRADELTAQHKRLSPEYTKLMERTRAYLTGKMG